MNNRKVLTKSSHDKWLFGVIGGFGEYFNINPNTLRIGFIIFSLLPGPSLIFYVICALIMPNPSFKR